MANKTLNVKQQQKRDTATNWATNNPVLLAGELGFETDTKKFKLGDGTTAWNSLGYVNASSGSSIDVQVNGTSIISNGIANLITNTAYNSSSNKIATMSDIPTESDPIFSASASAGITSSNITTWNNSAINEYGNEYIRYENGIQICWGNLTSASSSGATETKIFPKPFKATDNYLSVVVSKMSTSSTNDTYRGAGFSTISNTDFTAVVSSSTPKYYVAIGLWK